MKKEPVSTLKVILYGILIILGAGVLYLVYGFFTVKQENNSFPVTNTTVQERAVNASDTNVPELLDGLASFSKETPDTNIDAYITEMENEQ